MYLVVVVVVVVADVDVVVVLIVVVVLVVVELVGFATVSIMATDEPSLRNRVVRYMGCGKSRVQSRELRLRAPGA